MYPSTYLSIYLYIFIVETHLLRIVRLELSLDICATLVSRDRDISAMTHLCYDTLDISAMTPLL